MRYRPMRSRLTHKATLAIAAMVCAHHADAAGQPAALVDSISITVPGVAPMEYLPAGTTIDLGTGGLLVLDYLASCVREEITGGTIKIGTTQSAVDKGTVSRRRVECDGAELQITAVQSDRGGTVTYRSALNKGPDGLPLPDIILRSRAPFIAASQAGTIRIERLDAEEPARDIIAEGSGRIGVDLARMPPLLSAGGLYRATAGARSLVFRIAPDAGGAEMARLSRLLPL